MRSGMRSQWRLMSAGEMCSERRIGLPNMSRAVAQLHSVQIEDAGSVKSADHTARCYSSLSKAEAGLKHRRSLTIALTNLLPGLTVKGYWQTHATLCSMANVHVNARCDKLASELSWQRFTSKAANFRLLHLHLTYPTGIWRLRWGWPRLSFADIFGSRNLESLCYRVALFVRSYTFSRFSRTPTCDRRIDRQTHDDS